MNIKDYLEIMTRISGNILELIDEESSIDSLINRISQYSNQFILENRENTEIILHFLSKICKYHHRSSSFFKRIQILFSSIKKPIQNYFSNDEIYNFFKGDKRILLLLIEEDILTIDKNINKLIMKYNDYLCPEIKKFNGFENILNSNDFEENRRVGENHNYICKLVRNDSLIEFIQYVNQTNFSITSKINHSIFETNSFLLKNEPTLIEYSAFFGSIQIFKFLFLNNIELKPSLWIYAIHGRNPEIIHILENNLIAPNDKTYRNCFIESIKCHHSEITEYIQNNLLKIKGNDVFELYSKSLKYFNFRFFPDDLNNDYYFYHLCKYNYITLVKLLLNVNKINVNSKIISNKKIFLIQFLN